MNWIRLSKDDFRWVAGRRDIRILKAETVQETPIALPVHIPLGEEECFAASYSCSPLFLARIHDVTVLGPNGYVVTGDGFMIRESAARLADGVAAFEAYHGVEARRPPSLISDVPLLVGTQRYRNYYHWWLDIIPRIWFAETVLGISDHTLIVPPLHYAFQRESLDALGVRERSTELGTGPVRFPALYVTQGLAFGAAQNISPSVTHYATWLRNRIATDGPPPEHPRRLVVTREKARQRRIVNAHEVRCALGALGFTAIDLEELQPREQRAVFRSAEVVVAVHGAGLANLLFAPAGSLVIELFPRGGVHDSCYRRLAHHLGMRYGCIEGVAHGDPIFSECVNSDLMIDVPTLLEQLNEMLS